MSKDNPSTRTYVDWSLRLGPFRFGFERSDVMLRDPNYKEPDTTRGFGLAEVKLEGTSIAYDRSNPWTVLYLQRWIIYPGLGTLRLHHFLRGDEERAFHDHPWWFITFPVQDYFETVEQVDRGCTCHIHRNVSRFRFHFRRAGFRHRVTGSTFASKGGDSCNIWTLVITGRVKRLWGYWPEPTRFVPYRQWK